MDAYRRCAYRRLCTINSYTLVIATPRTNPSKVGIVLLIYILIQTHISAMNVRKILYDYCNKKILFY